MVKISPSILSCDFCHMAEEMENLKKAGADMAHIDVMDGRFVPNISFGMPIVSAIRKVNDLFFDVHLMIVEPQKHIERFADAGADLITFHLEATDDVENALKMIKNKKKLSAVSIKPATPAEAVFPYLDLCDMVLVMTVEPGYGGQKLIPETLAKVTLLKREIERRNLSVKIEVDGGINSETAKAAIDAGADILVAGSAVFGKPDMKKAIDDLRLS